MTVRELMEALRRCKLRHYAFVSYPNTNPEMREFSAEVANALHMMLSDNLLPLHEPDGKTDGFVFHDKTEVRVGEPWERRLGEAACQSVCLVALCLPTYPDTKWCGREWGGMLDLKRRVFPVKLGRVPLPAQLTELQWCDLSGERTCDLAKDKRFGPCIKALFDAIYGAAVELANQCSPRDCGNYRLPPSPFGSGSPPPLASRQS